MAFERIPFGAPGVPAFELDDGFTNIELLIGNTPAWGAPMDFPVKENSAFPIYSVVGRDADGNMAFAKADGSVVAEAITTVPVATGAGVTTSCRVHTSGHVNMNALAWDASFNTDAKKVAAFQVGRSNIVIGKNPYDRTSIDV